MTVKESAAFLRQHDNYLILTHKRPDGDTIGCAAALCEGLRALGRTAWICPHAEETHLFTPIWRAAWPRRAMFRRRW